ncbi:fungal-specific transcription factor domain-containing protein [Colletotrichum acutatum]|uniref:Fungal-specific transcription factor domain-containing protein n=1 Tax=Glomerella acutata TaxID=27357 RepID=A0AAD8UU57_GLOAC|nr:fungal-specific transcription factor domain-containing protein [Colletotrichum acutatum]KAK1728585.1 fungal-specific transcription factor domain-containing protein [Colletotrichum acutatum]
MDPTWESRFPPTVSKACSRCHARKVKCDLRVPRCSTCEKQNEQCNITDRVTYTYAAVKSLQDRIIELQVRLDTVSEATASQTGPVAGPGQFDDVRKEAEEIGVLAVGRPSGYSERIYMGSATGSTFARIFFKQINLSGSSSISRPGRQDFPSHDHELVRNNATLPPQPVARFLLTTYISRIHPWWPFVSLPFLRSSLARIYEDPARCTLYQKFLILMVLALASATCTEAQEYRRMMDLNTPTDYFQTGLQFFLNIHDHPRDLQGLHSVLLLCLWMLGSNIRNHGDDLWQMSRYAMSTAIEMGLHRRSVTPGDLSSDDREIRNRTWWCVYALERQVAVITGRVLSVREHAIDAPKPSVSTLDELTDQESRAAPSFQKLNVKLFNHLMRLRQIGGRVLESIYIARGPDGRASRTTFQEICNEVEKIQQELESWKRDLETLNFKGTREYSEVKIEYGLLLLLMYRPSPTFMIPSKEMAEICSRAVSGTVQQWQKLDFQHGITAVCRCIRQVHSILMVGLAGLYCDWHVKAMDQSPESPLLYSHGSNVALCMDLIERGTARMKEEGLLKYRDLLQAARIKVYGPRTWEPPVAQTQPTDASPVAPVNAPNTLGLLDADNTQSNMFFQGDGLETYMNQVTGYFYNAQLGLDEGLTAWFDTFMDEFQSNRIGNLG